MKSQIVRKILFLILLVILYNVQVFGKERPPPIQLNIQP